MPSPADPADPAPLPDPPPVPAPRPGRRLPVDRTIAAALINSVGAMAAAGIGFAVGNSGVAGGGSSGTAATVTVTVAPSPEVTTPPATASTAQLRIPRGSGADVDADPASVAGTDGPNGRFDLYWDGENLRANGGDFYAWAGASSPGSAECAAEAEDGGGSLTYLAPTPGTSYCFVTSEGAAAWLRVNDKPVQGDVVVDVRLLA